MDQQYDHQGNPIPDDRPDGARFEDQLVFDKLVISKLDQIKTIKEEAIAKMDFEKALKAKEAITILESIGENLNNIFKVKLKYIREDNREQAEYYTNAYNMVQSTLLKYEFEYDEE